MIRAQPQRGHRSKLGVATADQSRGKKTKGTKQDYAGHSKAAPDFMNSEIQRLAPTPDRLAKE